MRWLISELRVMLRGSKLGPEVISLFSMLNSAKHEICLKLLTVANSLLINIAEHENLTADKYENANYCWHFHIN